MHSPCTASLSGRLLCCAVLCVVGGKGRRAWRSSVPASLPRERTHVMSCRAHSAAAAAAFGQEGVRTVRGNDAWQLTADARRSLPAS
eukprot:COSAG01_NODE_3839_length_5646_cov_8.715934_6_plen_87_part_00